MNCTTMTKFLTVLLERSGTPESLRGVSSVNEKKKIAKISIRMKSCFLCQTLFSNVCLESWPSLRRRGRSRKKQSALFLLLIESCALQLRLSMIDLQHKKAAKQKLIEEK